MSESARETVESDRITVLMTGAGAPGASGIIRSLRRWDGFSARIVGVDMDPSAYGFALVEEGYTVPAGDDEGYISQMEAIAEEEAPDVILPLTTAELQPLARNRERFDATVMVSAVEPLAVANNKAALYQFLEAEGFESAPEFRVVGTEAGFVDAVKTLGYPEQPVCFKPPVASGMRGFRVLDQAADRLRRLLSEKPGTAVTTLSEIRPVLSSADSFPELVVMEHLPGQEYSVDVLATPEGVHPVVPRTREQTRAGITFRGKVERAETLIEEAKGICRELGVEYNANLQFKYDASGTPKLIEINPRVAGTIIMCTGAGANMPALGVTSALGKAVPAVDVEWGTRMNRYWTELFRDPDGSTFHVGPDTGMTAGEYDERIQPR